MPVDFHDATLRSISVDWAARTVEFALATVNDGRAAVVARGLVSLVVPYRAPWGSSVSVLELQGPSRHEEGWSAVLVMQTGDEIVVISDEIDLVLA